MKDCNQYLKVVQILNRLTWGFTCYRVAREEVLLGSYMSKRCSSIKERKVVGASRGWSRKKQNL